MSMHDRYRALEEALRRQVDEMEKIVEEAAARARAADERTSEPLAEVRDGVQEARQIADTIAQGGGEAAADLATEKLILAINQLAAVLQTVGETLDRKFADLDYHNSAGAVEERVEATADDGRVFVASPTFDDDARYHFPGGAVGGRLIPRGWYSIPWWRDIKVPTSAASVGGGLVFGTLAHEFYDKVLAQLPGKPSHEVWAKGVTTTYRVSADWWPFDGPGWPDWLL